MTRDPGKTKQVLLESAYKVIHQKGYKAASVNDILKDTGLTRGAMYHHFPNKKALGMSALDYMEKQVQETWLAPLEFSDDPLGDLKRILLDYCQSLSPEEIMLGCLLNNLAQEMSSEDEDFRQRIVGIYDMWRMGLARSLWRGQGADRVRQGVNPLALATFLVSSLSGARGLAKTSRNAELLMACAKQLAAYLDWLRA